MKIGIDCRFLTGSHSRKSGGNIGHGVYTSGLVGALPGADHDNDYTLYVTSGDVTVDNGRGNFTVRQMPAIHRNGYLRAFVTFPAALLINPVDVFHGMYSLPVLPLRKAVVTMFEFSWILFPEFYSAGVTLPLNVMTRLSIKRADRIITGSQFMKAELTGFFRIPDEQVAVIPLAVDESFFARFTKQEALAAAAKYGIRGDYIIAVGDVWPKKNLERLIAAFHLLRVSHNVKVRLVLVGGMLWKSQPLRDRIAGLGIGDEVILTGFVPLSDLKALYQGASLFVFPSLYEGFGLPVLEAMASGVPSAVSRVSSLPEVAGSAALYFDPYDVESQASTILRLLEDSALRQSLSEKGLQRARQFTWDRVAQATVAVYQSLT